MKVAISSDLATTTATTTTTNNNNNDDDNDNDNDNENDNDNDNDNDDDNNNDDDDDIGEPPDSREREERKQHAKVMRDTKIYYKIHLRSEIQKSAFNKVDEDESRRGRRILYHRSGDSKYKR